MPDHKTIVDFRKDNGPAIRKVCARFAATPGDAGPVVMQVDAITMLLKSKGRRWEARAEVTVLDQGGKPH